MGFSFLAPAFLVGLAALAVPVLVHLIHRERKEVVAFPSLMFLHQIPFKSVRRQKIRHWLLFALRCLALALLVVAFARPFLQARGTQTIAAGTGAREVVILVDRSYSMGYGDRWRRALEAARGTINGLGSDDRATVVFFADRAQAVTEATSDRAQLLAAVSDARPGSGRTRYAPALRLAQQIAANSELPRREVVLITDFQKVAWDGSEEISLPAGTTLTRVNLAGGDVSNLTVTGVELHRDLSEGRERVTATARLAARGGTAFKDAPVTLTVNGRALETRKVTVEPNAAATVTFAPIALPDGSSRGTVHTGGDALPVDNSFHFVLSRGQALSVLVVEPPDARASASLYLTRALAIGDQPPFRVQRKRSGDLRGADLEGRSLVILHDAPFPQGEMGRRLRAFVERGGGLLVALGERSSARGWSGGTDLLPAEVGSLVDRTADRGGLLGYLDRDHPALSLFGAPRSGDFSGARFFRYRTLTPAAGVSVLARFDDGAVAMAEREVGAGRVVIWASTFDNVWNDLPVQPVFLPLVQQLAKYTAGYTPERASLTVGEALDAGETSVRHAGGTPRAPAPELVATAPSGERTRLGGNSTPVLELSEQGFYEVRPASGPGSPRVVAVNLDVTESDLSAMDPEELAVSVGGITSAATVAREAEATLEERERRQALWWFLLATALLLLAAETVISNRLSRAAR